MTGTITAEPVGRSAAAGQPIDPVLQRQQAFFDSGVTREYIFRSEQLKRLRAMVQAGEERIFAALAADMHKPRYEAYGGEIGIVYAEISHALKHLKKWMKPQPVGTPLTIMPARSYIYSEPVGRVLIIGPWNYPVNLVLAPLVAAIAAGNVAVIKPSELAPATSAVLAELISETFPAEFVTVFEGGADVAQALLARRFDHIFFTGGVNVGKVVAKAAAEHLTPVTLEMGGKSPCVVAADADLDLAARRIVWGKFFNAGQTCVAPDYVLVHASVKEPLLERMAAMVTRFYGADPAASPDFARIISERHAERLAALLAGARLVVGGQVEPSQRYVAPTIIDGVGLDHPSMADEIFGPILPVLAFDHLDEAVSIIRQRPNPLALYVFTRDGATERRLLREIPFGGGCVNDVVMQFTNVNLPFGGVGGSGIGGYHGKHGFDRLTHKKGVVRSSRWFDPPFRYLPYDAAKLKLVRWFLR